MLYHRYGYCCNCSRYIFICQVEVAFGVVLSRLSFFPTIYYDQEVIIFFPLCI